MGMPIATGHHKLMLTQAASYGVDANLVRMSVGLEETSRLCDIFQRALGTLANRRHS